MEACWVFGGGLVGGGEHGDGGLGGDYGGCGGGGSGGGRRVSVLLFRNVHKNDDYPALFSTPF